MTPTEIIERVSKSGMSLRLKDDGLSLVGKNPPTELVTLLKANRSALLAYLRLNASKPDREPHRWNKNVGDLELLYADGKITRAIDDDQPDGVPTHFRTSRREGWVVIPEVPA